MDTYRTTISDKRWIAYDVPGNIRWYHLSAPSARLAEDLILAHTIAMIIWPLAFTFPYYFRASGSAAFTMVISIVSIWIFRVGLAHLLLWRKSLISSLKNHQISPLLQTAKRVEYLAGQEINQRIYSGI